MRRGFFLSLDGVDGAGKTTQCRMLADWLRAEGLDVVTCRDPGGTVVGESIRSILLGRQVGGIDRRAEMLLYMASRAQLTAEVIRPALEGGKVVVSDRYLLANVVYQGYGGGLDVEELWRVGRVATGGLLPDLTVVLDLELTQARHRKNTLPDRMEAEPDDFFQRVREGFLREACRVPGAIQIVSVAGCVEEVQERLRDIVRRALAAAGI